MFTNHFSYRNLLIASGTCPQEIIVNVNNGTTKHETTLAATCLLESRHTIGSAVILCIHDVTCMPECETQARNYTVSFLLKLIKTLLKHFISESFVLRDMKIPIGISHLIRP